MTKLKQKGMITITLAISVGMIIVGGISTFYTVKGATDKEIAKTNERVSVVETQTTSILKSLERVEQSNAEIIKILMTK